MSPMVQIPLPPTPLNRVGTANDSVANKECIALIDAILRAAGRVGLSDKELAAVFGLPPAEFSKCFSHNYPERNRQMKVQLPLRLVRELAHVLIDASGLKDEAQSALVESLVRLVAVNR